MGLDVLSLLMGSQEGREKVVSIALEVCPSGDSCYKGASDLGIESTEVLAEFAVPEALKYSRYPARLTGIMHKGCT